MDRLQSKNNLCRSYCSSSENLDNSELIGQIMIFRKVKENFLLDDAFFLLLNIHSFKFKVVPSKFISKYSYFINLRNIIFSKFVIIYYDFTLIQSKAISGC